MCFIKRKETSKYQDVHGGLQICDQTVSNNIGERAFKVPLLFCLSTLLLHNGLRDEASKTSETLLEKEFGVMELAFMLSKTYRLHFLKPSTCCGAL